MRGNRQLMIRRTYGQVKDYLAALAGNTGMAVSNPLVMGYANNAVRELMNLGDWPGVVDRWYFRFDEMTGLVTLPYELERLLAVTVDDTPKEIRSPWFEFVQYGPGQMHDEETDTQGNTRPRKIDWFNVAADRGDAATQFPLPVDGGPWNLRVKGFVDETVEGVNPTINLQGLDFTGHPVRTLSDGTGSGDWVNGEDIAIEDGVVHTSASTFSTVAAVAKPVTASHVLLTAWNGVTEVTLADYEWNDTAPTYRQILHPLPLPRQDRRARPDHSGPLPAPVHAGGRGQRHAPDRQRNRLGRDDAGAVSAQHREFRWHLHLLRSGHPPPPVGGEDHARGVAGLHGQVPGAVDFLPARVVAGADEPGEVSR